MAGEIPAPGHLMTSIPVADVPLKERYYVYRGVVLHHRTSAAHFDDLYWQIKNGALQVTIEEKMLATEKIPPGKILE